MIVLCFGMCFSYEEHLLKVDTYGLITKLVHQLIKVIPACSFMIKSYGLESEFFFQKHNSNNVSVKNNYSHAWRYSGAGK